MGSLNSIVNVSITRQTSVPSRAGFGTGAFVSSAALFATATKSYASLQEMTDDSALVGYDSLDFGAAYFGQQVSPTKLTIIKDSGGTSEIGEMVVTGVMTAGDKYVMSLDGVLLAEVDFINDASDSLDALATELLKSDQIFSAIGDGVDTVDIVFADVRAHTLNVAVTGVPTIAYAATTPGVSDIDASITAAISEDNDWYALCQWSRVAADITSTSALIQGLGNANPKLFFAQTSDADVLTAVDTDIASTLQALAAFRTSIWHHADDTEYLDGGVIGGQLPSDPGSITWAYKTVSSVTVGGLTSSEKAFAHGKACNTYDSVASVSITEEGKVSDSPFEWIDVIRGLDWVQVNMAADLFTLLVQLPKLAYDTAGIALVGATVSSVLSRAQAQSILSVDSDPVVVLPLIGDIPAVDKANRVLNGVTFSAVLARAVQKINVQGTVTL